MQDDKKGRLSCASNDTDYAYENCVFDKEFLLILCVKPDLSLP